MSRIIKDIKDKNSGQLVYPRTHIKAVVIDESVSLEDLIGTNVGQRLDNTEEIIANLETSKQDVISDLEEIRSGASKGETAVQPSSLSAVATSGSYNDLSDKPIIPSGVTESTVSGWGFTKNTGTYSKPSEGIPKSDLTTAVQTSLNNADYYIGNNNVTSIASVPVDKRLVIATISSSQSLSLASNLSAGKEVHIIIYNSGSSSISIALPNTGNYKCLVDTALSIDAGNYAEINIISDGTNMYIRAV